MAVTRNADAVAPVRRASPLSIWFRRHTSTSRAALARLLSQPLSSLMIVLVIGVTLALPAAVNVIVSNLQSVSGNWDDALDFSVFLNRDVTAAEADALAGLLGQRADIASVQIIYADDALDDFKAHSGFGGALDQLNENPLPHTLIVRPSAGSTGESMVLLREEIENLPETELVQLDTEWVQRFHAILDIVRKAIAIGAALLGIAIVVVVGNTIRLDIENRREEIEVTKLIGANNAFVRRPFLWTGFWYGLFGSVTALLLVQTGLFLLREPVGRLAGLYQGQIAVAGPDLRESAMMIGAGVLLGLIASWFTVARHMRRIDPR